MTKFKIGDKVKVLELETKIENIIMDGNNEPNYYFRDEQKKLWYAWEFDIVLID